MIKKIKDLLWPYYWPIATKEVRWRKHIVSYSERGVAERMININNKIRNSQKIEICDIWAKPFTCWEYKMRDKLFKLVTLSIDKNIYDRKSISDEILSKMQIVRKAQCTFEFLDLIEGVFNAMGDFNNGYKARRLTQKFLIKSYSNVKKCPRRLYSSLFWSYMEFEDYSNAKILANSIYDVRYLENSNQYRSFFRLIGFAEYDIKFDVGKYRNSDDNFKDLVRGKKIAVIGPGIGDLTNINKENYDLIVAINYCQNQKLKVIPNVSYYNGKIASDLLEKNRDYLNDLKFMLFRTDIHEFQKEICKDGKARIFAQPYKLFYNGIPNMLPNVLFDLLQFEPESINLFNFNFYISEKLYADGYTSPLKKGDDYFLWRDFAYHNSLSQFSFVKALSKCSKVKFDEVGNKVLSLSTEEFIKRLHELYGVKES